METTKRGADSEDHGDEQSKRPKLEEDETKPDNASARRPETSEKDTAIQRLKGKRHKYAMLLSYCGQAYYGMQIQQETEFQTVEQYLFDVLLKLRLIDDNERARCRQFWFQRAARTDKGVSAIRQVCSLILPLKDDRKDNATENNEGTPNYYTPITVVDAMNALLPEDIRVMGIKRVTRSFDAKNSCESRTYAYTLPSYAFSKKDEDTSNFRISEERLAEVNEILSMYEGTHNYFNFTCRRTSTDASCARYIMSCKCGKPFLRRDDLEFVTVHLTGQSFMLHQIRKMIGLCIAIVRGHAERKVIERAWIPSRLDVPIAPSLGLVLDQVHYEFYNKKFEKTHEPLEWSKFEDKIQAFKERYIDAAIFEMEKKESTVLQWMKTLHNHDFDSTRSEAGGENLSSNRGDEIDGNVSD